MSISSEITLAFVRHVLVALILEVVSWTHHILATDCETMSLTLLGLCHDVPTDVLLPNYKQPPETIIADIVCSMMKTHRSLDLM